MKYLRSCMKKKWKNEYPSNLYRQATPMMFEVELNCDNDLKKNCDFPLKFVGEILRWNLL